MLTLITTLAPLIGGFLMGMFRAHMDHKNRQWEMLIEKAGLEEKSRRRAGNLKGKYVAWTRRFLAVLFSCALVGMISLVMAYGVINPEATINVPHEVTKHSLWSAILPWVSAKTTTEYIQLKGFTVVLPLLRPVADSVLMIVGFYFGAGGSRSNGR